ncbi:DUF3866 family protein [Blastococcus sp. Marseille-P5729]|uniref:DUF3866 family protein n=1 Tax=Blastococcus sp. Marseille-P5729 TaxID=2086582 RepID=UPI000D10125E|nr:DUF3866 family protein [Blastococcus sp. Marseille-P5729]
MQNAREHGSLIRWRQARVDSLGKGWRGAQELRLTVQGRGDEPDFEAKGIAYPALVGLPAVGDRVLVNTTALAMGLGTGGYAVVIANLDRLPEDREGAGHLVKMRYSPLQATVLGVDEQDSPHHAAIAARESVDGMPVVAADLHSALPAIVAGVRADRPAARIAYVWTDGGALPAWFSRTVAELGSLLCGTITVGQAVGGDLEAVTVHSGLIAAREVLRADLAIVTQGPGNLGTGTPWGFSGVAAGEALNAAYAVGGRPVGALRISDADPRGRHVGVSHHSTTAFFKVGLVPVDIPLPAGLAGPDGDLPTSRPGLGAAITRDLAALPDRATIHEVHTEGLDDALRAVPVRLSTMGRGLDEDYAYFLVNAAAGRFAAGLLSEAAVPPAACPRSSARPVRRRS